MTNTAVGAPCKGSETLPTLHCDEELAKFRCQHAKYIHCHEELAKKALEDITYSYY